MLFYVYKNQKDEIVSLQNDYLLFSDYSSLMSSKINPEFPLNEEDLELPFEQNIDDCFNNPLELSFFKPLFEDIEPKKACLFSSMEKDTSTKEEIFNQRKRYSIRRRRKENNDNIRKKIKRAFLNSGLIQRINMIIKNKGGNTLFKKFKQDFVSDVSKKTNRELLNMTLEEIFRKRELYQEKELIHYYHNLKLIERKEIQENEDLKHIFNLKYCELFEEYINSKEFRIDEINRLKENKMDDLYIQRYINLARHFIEFIKEQD
jgi:hypothetical protein